MAYSDLAAIQVPADNAAALATWGAQVNDNSAAFWALLAQPWKGWAATPTAGITAVGNAEQEGYYHALGYTITGQWAFKIGSTTTMSGAAFTLALPVNAAAGPAVVGSCVLLDSSAGKRYGGVVVLPTAATTTAELFLAAGALTSTSPVTLATGDTIMVHVFYEAGALTGI